MATSRRGHSGSVTRSTSRTSRRISSNHQQSNLPSPSSRRRPQVKWIPEPKPPTGGLAAEGFYKLLGRPRLDPLTVLVRETAQNSWDARLENGVSVDFSIQGWVLDEGERQALRERVFVEAGKAK